MEDNKKLNKLQRFILINKQKRGKNKNFLEEKITGKISTFNKTHSNRKIFKY